MVEETYTDNVRLAPRGQEESDWVTEISPGVTVTGQGARLQLRADYALTYKHYLNATDGDGINHFLSSYGLWDAWNKEVFVQANASVSQQNVSPLGQTATSNANLTGNRTDVKYVSVSPYWVRPIGNWARLDARYLWSRQDTSGDFNVYNSEVETISLGLTNGPAFSNLGWGVNYRFSKTESTQNAFDNREAESTIGNVRYPITPTFAVTGTLGYESNDYSALNRGSTSGTSWSVGGDWAPSNRTHVSGAVGERYFGSTYKFDASHRTRLTNWMLSYSQDVNDAPFIGTVPITGDTTASVDRLFLSRIPDPRERQVAVQTFIAQNGLPSTLNSPVQFPTNQVTLVKRLQGGFGMLGARGTLLVNVFREDRENLSVSQVKGPFDPFSITNNVEQIGYSTTLSWRLSARTSATASLSQTWNKYTDAAREDTDNYVRLGLTHQIQPKVHGAIQIKWNDRSSDDVTSDYRERAVVGTLRMTF